MLASCLSFLDSASFSDSLTDIRPRCDNQLSPPTESQWYFLFSMLLHSPWPDVYVPAMLASCLSFLDSASFSDSLTDIRPRCDNQLSLPTESQGYFIFTPLFGRSGQPSVSFSSGHVLSVCCGELAPVEATSQVMETLIQSTPPE
jgi:hypothetical protein